MELVGEEAVDRPTRRVAIVEHDPDNRVLMVAMLEPRYDVISCGRAAEAVPAIRHHRPHVVLWGVGEDDAEGPAAFEDLRRDPPLGDAAIVAVTASVRRDSERYWLWLGFDGFVAKPILDKTELWRIIDGFSRGDVDADRRRPGRGDTHLPDDRSWVAEKA
jgi:CheY-like chemotaxis protein